MKGSGILIDLARLLRWAGRCDLPAGSPASASDSGACRTLTGSLYAHGFSLRKRQWVRKFTGRDDVRFVDSARALPADATLLLWGSAPAPPDTRPGVAVVRLEDGFLRSVGLGADLIAPLSWVLDARGIYYSAAIASDLEHLLQTTDFDAAMLARAAALRQQLVALRLSKYNLNHVAWQRPAGQARVVLVTGQVETDASIRHGAPGVCSNLGLLRAVREAAPEAYIVYKPHPDVVAGLRAAGQSEDEAAHWCNEVLTRASITDLLDQVDEVHVMTSLTGFEALLRGRRVVCYGQPFYASYGLTHDLLPLPRRTRRLSLDALVAGALILYPVYVSRATGLQCEVEQAVNELSSWRDASGAPDAWWRKCLRPLLRRP